MWIALLIYTYPKIQEYKKKKMDWQPVVEDCYASSSRQSAEIRSVSNVHEFPEVHYPTLGW